MFLEKYYKFQFHYGTIKRRKTSVISRAVMAYFNSTMVRLKGYCNYQKDLFHGYFNSTMVRLKVVLSCCAF